MNNVKKIKKKKKIDNIYKIYIYIYTHTQMLLAVLIHASEPLEETSDVIATRTSWSQALP